jgi:hypothetical protein
MFEPPTGGISMQHNTSAAVGPAATLRQNAESAMKRFEKIPLMKP